MLHRASLVRSWLALGVTSVSLLGFLATYLISPLNGNIRYEAGVKEVSTFSAAGTFSHRPLAFRMLMDGVFRLAHAITPGIASFELVVRMLVALMTVGAGVLLWRGLRRHGVRHSGQHSLVVVGAVLLIGPLSAGEPDWMAVVLAVAGAGVALLGRGRPWLWALLSAVLFVGAAGMKVVSLPTALLGLGVVALLDRRQFVRALVSSTLVGVLYVVVTLVWVPWELQWLLDIRAVQKSALDNLPNALPFFAELTFRRPVLALVPAALVLAGRRERLVTLVAVATSAGMVLGQGQYFSYHAVPLIVVAAVAVFRALRPRMSTTTGVVMFVIVAGAVALTTVSGAVLANYQRLLGGAEVVVGVAAVGWAFLVRSRRVVGGRSEPLLAALVILALLYPGASPWSAQLLRPEDPSGRRPWTTLQSRTHDEAVGRQVREVVGGRDVQVTYLTFGQWTYFVDLPTDCRYPSPLFLQRTRYARKVVGTPSYEENLACLTAPGSRWLVWDPSWFALKRTPQPVQATVARTWDCGAAKRVGGLVLCPRRT